MRYEKKVLDSLRSVSPHNATNPEIVARARLNLDYGNVTISDHRGEGRDPFWSHTRCFTSISSPANDVKPFTLARGPISPGASGSTRTISFLASLGGTKSNGSFDLKVTNLQVLHCAVRNKSRNGNATGKLIYSNGQRTVARPISEPQTVTSSLEVV